MRPRVAILAVMTFLGMMMQTILPGCMFTLPFDELTGGVPPGGPPPASRWSFDETSGVVAKDSIGTNTGVLNAEDAGGFPKWAPDAGKRGGALEFGLDGWVLVPGLSGPRFTPKGTIVMWVRIREYFKDDEDTFTWDVSEAGADDEDPSPFAATLTAGNIFFEATTFVPGQSETAPSAFVSTPSVPPNTWVLIATAWDIPGNAIVLFVRPEGKDPFPIQRGIFPPGFVLKSPELYFFTENGSLDEVRYYDRVLSDEELAKLD